MDVNYGFFSVSFNPIFGWFHLVVVYLGPNNGQGLVVYVNGTEVGRTAVMSTTLLQPGNGQLVIGKGYGNDYYSSVVVDELTLWNRELSDQEIMDLHQMFP